MLSRLYAVRKTMSRIRPQVIGSRTLSNIDVKDEKKTTDELDEDDDMEEMFVQGPAGMEWGGPTRGGARPEPTRFGDWERKGRTSDF